MRVGKTTGPQAQTDIRKSGFDIDKTRPVTSADKQCVVTYFLES